MHEFVNLDAHRLDLEAMDFKNILYLYLDFIPSSEGLYYSLMYTFSL
jgi:hypothetical protein